MYWIRVSTQKDGPFGDAGKAVYSAASGGARENGTPDLLDANESRYQLRHSPG